MTPKHAAEMMQECADLTRAEIKNNLLYGAEVAEQEALQKGGGLASDKTLRDEFAGQAMAAVIELGDEGYEAALSEWSCRMADAMLQARKTPTETKP
jgi:hypothetical protein